MAADQVTAPSLRQQYLGEYDVWKAMRNRCSNPANASWKYYGAKGVTVCDRWQASFAAFLEDMGPRPTPEHQIDRLKNELGYDPGNCQWATPAEQQTNTSKIVPATFRGVTLPLHVWADLFDIPASTLKSRLGELGWDLERALKTPVNVTMSRRRHGINTNRQ